MGYTILLYGATGYSGRLIAAEGRRRTGAADGADMPEFRMVLAGRDGPALAQLAGELGMEHRVFRLENRHDVTRELTDVDVVLNAAGPFAFTANALARSALAAGCHYVDINGEANVYMKLDDLGRHARQRRLALVCSAGHTAAASDLLLHAALTELGAAERAREYGRIDPFDLGAVRIALSRVLNLSRGSIDTLCRSFREQVTVVRMGLVDANGGSRKAQVLWHEPVGKLERTFEFRDGETTSDGATARIASAANLVDTLTARLTVARHRFAAHRIESYVETGTVGRLGYQLASLLAPIAAVPWARDLALAPLNALPAGPTPHELEIERATVVLEIEDSVHRRIIDWRWHTPNPYTFTARVVVEIAGRVATSELSGWVTPSDVLETTRANLTSRDGYLRECRLDPGPLPVFESA